MHIQKLFSQKEIVYSFEVFPPKKDSPIESVSSKLEQLAELQPDFISVTYGAGGNLQDNRTCELAALIRSRYGVEALAHLTGINSDRAEVLEVLRRLKDSGIENVLALRGDRNKDVAPKHDFPYAVDLIRFVKENADMDVVAACYPECHPECASPDADIAHLKTKADAGASHLITQLFFDNEDFYAFMRKIHEAGISLPVEAGIMPVTNKKNIERLVTLCGASLPKKFARMMNRYEDNPEALFDAGIAYATDQIVDLLANADPSDPCRVSGIHLYTMNNPVVAERITRNIEKMLGR